MPRWRRRAGAGAGSDDADDDVVIDLTDRLGGHTEQVWSPEKRAELADVVERRRAEVRRREAERELAALRARHWSAARVLEEGRAGMEFWEHDLADPYAVLGLLPGATLDDAAAARRAVALECHPDRSAGGALDPDPARRMAAANAAYERLRQALRPAR